MKQPWGSQKSGVNITNHDILQHLSMSSGGSRPRCPQLWSAFVGEKPPGFGHGTVDNDAHGVGLARSESHEEGAWGCCRWWWPWSGPKKSQKNGQPQLDFASL